MTFANTESLFLIWLLPVLAGVFLYGFQRRKALLLRFSTRHGLSSTSPGPSTGRRWLKACLLLMSVLFIVLALSGPEYGHRWEELPHRGIDIVIALDCSRSMAAEDVRPSRLERAKRELVDLLNMFEGDRVGLVAFAGTAFLQCPLTLDYAIFGIFLDALTPEAMPLGGTNLPDAVRTALDAFDPGAHTDKAIIIITDGESTVGDPVAAASEAAGMGARIFTIGVGNIHGVPVPNNRGGLLKTGDGDIVLSRLDANVLRQMAETTGGAYLHVSAGDDDLASLYKTHIRGDVTEATMHTGRREVKSNRFQWVLFVAMVLLVAEIMTSASRRKMLGLLAATLTTMATSAQAASVHENIEAGIRAYGREEFASALSAFIAAQLEHPDDPAIAYNIGSAHYKLGQYDAARRHFESAASDAQNPDLRQKAIYNLGNTAFRQGNVKAAVELYERALTLDPEDEMARKNLEFAKKILAQKPQENEQSQRSGSREKTKPGKRPDANRTEKAEKDPASGKENGAGQGSPGDQAPQVTYGDELTSDDASALQNRPLGGSNDASRKGAATAGNTDNEPGETTGAGLSHMLNRLVDKPGQALMPRKGPRKVEKDW
jgi:Ca-activated chloride channel family protein